MNSKQILSAAATVSEEYIVGTRKPEIVLASQRRVPYLTEQDARLMVEAIDAYEDRLEVRRCLNTT
jgi:hypothetical protein